MEQTFSVEAAMAVGIRPAILLSTIAMMCRWDECNGIHESDGLYWARSKDGALAKMLPFMSSESIDNSVERLEETGLVRSQHVAGVNWYAVTTKGQGLLNGIPVDKKDLPKPRRKPQKKEFIPPTVAMVEEYARSIGYEIDARYFCDYYTANGWHIASGRKMTNWKQTVQTWKKHENGRNVGPAAEEVDKYAAYD